MGWPRLNLPAPTSAEDKAVTIARAAQRLLDELADLLPAQAQKLAGIADIAAWRLGMGTMLGALGHSQMMRAAPDRPARWQASPYLEPAGANRRDCPAPDGRHLSGIADRGSRQAVISTWRACRTAFWTN